MIWITAAVFFGVIFFSMYKTHHFVKSIILSVLQGGAALFAVNFIGSFIDVHIPLNWFSIAVSGAGGLPGVIMLLVSEIIL